MADIDAVDRQILQLLRDDARRSITNIAASVNLTAAPVKRRIERLEREGVIAGYTAIVDYERLGTSIEAYSELRITGSANAPDLLERLLALPEVEECSIVTGDADLLLRIRVPDTTGLRRLVTVLRHIPEVTWTNTMISLARRSRADLYAVDGATAD
jgi:Lrp/AsnC family leucine-responsive transcriptional regulator